MSTTIEWTDETWNATLGCDRVGSPGCERCYAVSTATIRAGNPNQKVALAFEGLTKRDENGQLDWTGRVNSLPDRLDIPFRWKKPRRVFVNSLSDLFHDEITTEFLAQIFAVMAATPRHTYQVLTKRHGRMRSLLNSAAFVAQVQEVMSSRYGLEASGGRWPLNNVWMGVSVENQQWADIRIPALLKTPAAVRFLSCEPLLGPVDLTWLAPGLAYSNAGFNALVGEPRIDQVIVGGESGPRARPMQTDWVRSLRDQCQTHGTAFFMKQWGAWVDVEQMTGDTHREVDAAHNLATNVPDMWKVGKKKAGRLLDGRTWDEMPSAVTA